MDYYRLTIPIPIQPWRWLRFRIVTILLLIAILSIALAWRRDHQKLAAEIAQLKNPWPHYESAQATGSPNSKSSGDSSSAWCPATMNGGDEWLQLEYEQAITPTAIQVYENYAPGCVVRITHVPLIGKEVTLWEGAATPAGATVGGLTTLPVTNGIKTGRIKVHLDTKNATGWNEIDAVGLVDANGKVWWATDAKASSTWNQPSVNAVPATLWSTPTSPSY